MQCFNPQEFNGTPCPCGVCMACRVNKTRDWSIRLLHESSYWSSALFVTYTYSDDFVPDNLSLRAADMQLFYKRLRKNIAPRKIAHFTVGEYGDESGRPHYHSILFGLSMDDVDYITKNWHYGFVKVLPYIGLATGNYVAGYVQKKLYGKAASYYKDNNLEPPKLLVSQGIGKRWCMSNKIMLLADKCLYVNGSPQGLPRYYRKLLGVTGDDLLDCREDYRKQLIRTHLDRISVTEMQAILQSKVVLRACRQFIADELDETGSAHLMDFIISVSVQKSRKAAQAATLSRMRQIKRGKF